MSISYVKALTFDHSHPFFLNKSREEGSHSVKSGTTVPQLAGMRLHSLPDFIATLLRIDTLSCGHPNASVASDEPNPLYQSGLIVQSLHKHVMSSRSVTIHFQVNTLSFSNNMQEKIQMAQL